MMLDDGRIIYDGSLDDLKLQWGKGKELILQFARPCSLEALRAATGDMPARWSLENEWTAKAWIPLDTVNISDLLGRVMSLAEIRDLRIVEPNTDDIVREIYRTGTGVGTGQRADAGADDAI
jgi:ABC-2 type transport system ATP-binding protein